jgi:hypothetical protein
MPIFLERFLLPVLAAAVMTVIVLNPFKLDRPQRISLLVCVLAGAYFVGHTLYKRNSAPTHGATPKVEGPKKTGDATTYAPKSPAVTGDGNKITYDQSTTHPEKKPETPKKE